MMHNCTKIPFFFNTQYIIIPIKVKIMEYDSKLNHILELEQRNLCL